MIRVFLATLGRRPEQVRTNVYLCLFIIVSEVSVFGYLLLDHVIFFL